MAVTHSKPFFLTKRPCKQEGVVLIVSLVFLIALTAVAAALMQNTSTDMKMSGASQDKLIASQETLSQMDEIIYNQVRKVNGTNSFTSALPLFPITPTVNKSSITTAQITIVNPLNLIVDCPHTRAASSVQVFKCNVLNVQVARRYGRTKNSAIQVNAGIAQQLINGSN
jgi:Tfp pilus assembly protein PilX